MKPVIAFDLEGVLIARSAGSLAHNKWFKSVGKLSERDIASVDNENYFDHVFDIMEKKTDLDRDKPEDRKLMTKLARSLFQEIYMHEIERLKGRIEIREAIDFAKGNKGRYTLALITTTPEEIVRGFLQSNLCEPKDIEKIFLLTIPEIFGFGFNPANKKDLLEHFVKKYGKPLVYFCDRKQDVAACRELGIKSALVTIDIYDEANADFRANSRKEMEKVISDLK